MALKMMESLATEIRSFYSLRDLHESIEKEIEQYKAVGEEYSQWLGSFLRDMEKTHGDEEWFKKLSVAQKSVKAKPKEEKKREEKGGGAGNQWVSYKGVLVSASEQGEAEILFDAIEEINRKIEQLNQVLGTVENLEKSALGKEMAYIAFFHNGVPEKIVLRHKRGTELAEKFEFAADFSMLQEVSP